MGQQPQASFADFACLLQCKWAYLQWSMELTRDVFDPLEEVTHERLLPALFVVPEIPSDLCNLAALPMQHGELGALNPSKEAPRNRATSKECTNHLMEASLGMCIFKADIHVTCLKQGRIAKKKR
eukprot:9442944-Ditylum_brightwellii.AAC.1